MKSSASSVIHQHTFDGDSHQSRSLEIMACAKPLGRKSLTYERNEDWVAYMATMSATMKSGTWCLRFASYNDIMRLILNLRGILCILGVYVDNINDCHDAVGSPEPPTDRSHIAILVKLISHIWVSKRVKAYLTT